MDTMLRFEFDEANLDNDLARLSQKDVDGLTFGAIQLDAKGTVLAYNNAESEITGRRKEDVIGHNFFNDIAPCCNKPGFRGIFDAGVKAGKLNARFDYTFDYRMNPTRVRIVMKDSVLGGSYWVFVKRL